MQTLKSRLRELKPAFILVYLSAMGCLSVFSVQRYLGFGFQPLNCLSFMGIIFGIYTMNRFTYTVEDFTNDIGRMLFFQKQKFFLMLAVASLLGSIGVLLVMQKLNWMHVLLLAMGFGYSYRLVPWYSRSEGFRLLRIKEMTLVKNLAVSFLWSSSVFVIPILYSGAGGVHPIMIRLLSAGLFISTFNNTLFDDIMDEPGDRVAGIKTLPTVWGGRNSMRLLIAVDLAWLIFISALGLAHRIDCIHAAFLAFLGLYPFLYLGLHARGRTPDAWIDFLSENDLLCFALGMLALSAR